MLWIAIAFISPILQGFANVLDNYFTNTLFKNIWALTFYSACFNVLFLPLVFLIQIPGLPPTNLLPFIFLIAAIEVAYLYPYYRALQTEDTSVVSSLFSLGRIFVPILAFLLVGEVLQAKQYFGFFVIIVASAALTFKPGKRFHFRGSFFFMLLSSALLSVEAVIYKHLFENVAWSTGFFWTTLFSAAITFSFLLFPKIRKVIHAQRVEVKRNAPIFLIEELLTFGGAAASTYAISLVPVTLSRSIGAFQPFFVLLYALVLGRFFPRMFRESIDRRSIVKKLSLFVIMVLGILLVV